MNNFEKFIVWHHKAKPHDICSKPIIWSMRLEHSAKPWTCTKLPLVSKTVVLSIFEWPIKTGFADFIIQPIVWIFLSYSCPSGIFGSDGKQNTTFKPVLGGVRIVALSISSHEQTQ